MKHFTREELYELAWSEPIARSAAKLGISDVALAKRCRREGVPLPPRGYWARLAAGQTIARPPLPPPPEKVVVTRPKPKKPNAGRFKRSPLRRFSILAEERIRPKGRLETLLYAIERSERSFSWGTAWGRDATKPWREEDIIVVAGKLRTGDRPEYRETEIRLWPMHTPRDKLASAFDSVGMVWTNSTKGWLFGFAALPTDAYYSIADQVSRGVFAEMELLVRGKKRDNGLLDRLTLRQKLTELQVAKGGGRG